MAEKSRGPSFIVNEQMNQCQIKINIIANKNNNNDSTFFLKKTNIFSGPQSCDTDDRTL